MIFTIGLSVLGLGLFAAFLEVTAAWHTKLPASGVIGFAILLSVVVGGGAFTFSHLEGWELPDSIYYAVVTLTSECTGSLFVAAGCNLPSALPLSVRSADCCAFALPLPLCAESPVTNSAIGYGDHAPFLDENGKLAAVVYILVGLPAMGTALGIVGDVVRARSNRGPALRCVHTKHSRKAGPFSVAGLKMDLPFHGRLAFTGGMPALLRGDTSSQDRQHHCCPCCLRPGPRSFRSWRPGPPGRSASAALFWQSVEQTIDLRIRMRLYPGRIGSSRFAMNGGWCSQAPRRSWRSSRPPRTCRRGSHRYARRTEGPPQREKERDFLGRVAATFLGSQGQKTL